MVQRRDHFSVRTEELRHENAGLEATVDLIEVRRRALVSECDALRIRLELITLATMAAQADLHGASAGSATGYCVRHGRPR
jgi:hypothetical protein